MSNTPFSTRQLPYTRNFLDATLELIHKIAGQVNATASEVTLTKQECEAILAQFIASGMSASVYDPDSGKKQVAFKDAQVTSVSMSDNVITFKNGADETLFTLTLPVYDGGAS